MLGWALVSNAAFFLSGPVLRYTLEARSYLMAMAAVFVASWCCALAIALPKKYIQIAKFRLNWADRGVHSLLRCAYVWLSRRRAGWNVPVSQKEGALGSRLDVRNFGLRHNCSMAPTGISLD